jgi:hypothetical protein
MECNDQSASELLPWYANGTLDDDDAAAVESHLADCGACREALDEFTRLQESALRAAAAPAAAARSEGRASLPAWLGWAVAAVLLVAMVLGFVPRPGEPTSSARLVHAYVVTAALRGQGTTIELPADCRRFGLYLIVDLSPSLAPFDVSFVREGGDEALIRLDAPGLPDSRMLAFELASDAFPPGTYTATVRSQGDPAAAERFVFTITRSD